MAVKTYDPKKVSVVCGAFVLSHFAEGSMITVEKDSDLFNYKTGTDGEGVRTKSNDHSATITIRLMQSSPSNVILDAFRKLDEYGNAGIFPFAVKDGSGITTISLSAAESAWVQKEPTVNYDSDATEREWVLRTDNLISTHGSN